MHTITIYGDPHPDGTPMPMDFTFPGDWGEITREQLPLIAKMLTITEEKTASRLLLLQALAGIPDEQMALVDAESVTFQVELPPGDNPFDQRKRYEWRLLPQLDWCFGQPAYRASLIPELTIGDTTWSGPDDRLGCFTLARFAFCDSMLAALAHAPDEGYIDKLLGALYQPKGSAWTNERIEEYAQRLQPLPPLDKLAAILNYRALRGQLTKVYWRVFEGGDDEPMESGLFGMIYDVCASGLFGDYAATKEQPLRDVMGYMQHQLEKDERTEARMKAQTA